MMAMMLWINLSAEELVNDIFQVEYSQKDARTAMLFSALIPGSGQFYANQRAITAYIFPVLEIGLWFGYFYYRSEGEDITKQYEQFAIQYYSREYQYSAQKSLIDNPLSDDNFYAPDDYDPTNPTDYGSGGHFRLDEDNTQHFYEDIGKYNKYIFGWQDWVEIYATIEGTSTWTGPHWIIDEGDKKWKGNDPINTESDYYDMYHDIYNYNNGIYSVLRAEYIEMRKDAETNFDNKRLCTYGLLFNHLLATIDAARVTRRYNIDHLTYNQWGIKIAPTYAEGNINPSLMLTYKF